jgi:DNA-binding NarL/FixJ family response regulator
LRSAWATGASSFSCFAASGDTYGGISGQPAPHAIAQLTDRQIDVLKHLCTGLSNKEISARLGIAEKTVKAHVAAIFKTLNVVNRTQAAHAVREAKLV